MKAPTPLAQLVTWPDYQCIDHLRGRGWRRGRSWRRRREGGAEHSLLAHTTVNGSYHCCNLTPSMSFFLRKHSFSPCGILLPKWICPGDWWRRVAADSGGLPGSEITSCFSLSFVFLYERECLRDFELYMRVSCSLSLSLYQTSCMLASPLLRVARLFAALIGSEI